MRFQRFDEAIAQFHKNVGRVVEHKVQILRVDECADDERIGVCAGSKE